MNNIKPLSLGKGKNEICYANTKKNIIKKYFFPCKGWELRQIINGQTRVYIILITRKACSYFFPMNLLYFGV